MPPRRQALGRRFGWLWAAYAVSAYGSGLGFGAFPLVAILVLHSGPTEVAALAAAGRAAGAVLAVPLGPWLESRRKRPVMMAMDLTRFAALISVPAAFAFGRLGYAQLLGVAVITATADLTFKAAGGAYLKSLVPPEQLLVANSRFESTTWTTTIIGPPLGGAAIGLFGPVTTMVADAVSYLLSALGIRAIGGPDPRPARAATAVRPPQPPNAPVPAVRTSVRPRPRPRAHDLLDGWRFILAHPLLRPLFLNSICVNGLIMAAEPLLAVLLLDHLGYAPWQYGFVFAAPCIGGLIGSRLVTRLCARYGRPAVLRVAGIVRACWPIGLAFVQPGLPGVVLIIVVQFGLVASCGAFNPMLATYRLESVDADRIGRTLSAWSVSSSASIAALTALWGVLASITSPRTAIAAAGVLLLATPLLLPREIPHTVVPKARVAA